MKKKCFKYYNKIFFYTIKKHVEICLFVNFNVSFMVHCFNFFSETLIIIN